MDPATIAPAPEVLFQEQSGEGMLLNLRSGRYYNLDAVGTRIWRMVMEGLSLMRMVSELLTEYDVSRERVEADILTFVNALADHRLVIRVPEAWGSEPSHS